MLFDLDDTLIERTEAFGRWLDERMSRLPGRFGADLRREILDRDASGRNDRAQFCDWFVSRFPSLGVTAGDLQNEIAAQLPDFVASAPEIVELVKRIGTDRYVAVVTNGSARAQRSKLAAAGLDLPALVSAELGAEKPDRRIFDAALRQAGCEASETLFVGDDPARDIAGAASAGMRTCWLSRGRDWPEAIPRPDHVISRLTELPELLA